MEKPKPPIGRILYEGDGGEPRVLARYIYENEVHMFSTLCPKCGSSLKKRFLFFRSKHCIQWRCSNYYGNNQSK